MEINEAKVPYSSLIIAITEEEIDIGDLKEKYISPIGMDNQIRKKISPTSIVSDISLAYWRGRQSTRK